MKKIALYCIFIFFGFQSLAQNANGNPPPQIVPGEVLVKVRGTMSGGHTGHLFRHLGKRVHVKNSVVGFNIHHLVIDDGTSATDMINELSQTGDVEIAEPNYIVSHTNTVYAQDTSYDQGGAAYAAVSNEVTSVWSEQAQTCATVTPLPASCTNTVVVAVLDTGLQVNHPVFVNTNAVWVNAGETGLDSNGNNKRNNGIDDDGNGYIDDVNGWNFAYKTNDPSDDNGHGTHVSGIIIGLGQNILPGATLAPSQIKIMPLKFMAANGQGATGDAIAAVYYAISKGARVINNSWGGTGYSQLLNDALTTAYYNHVFISSAAGNSSSNLDTNQFFPAYLNIPSQMTVASGSAINTLSSYSSYGAQTVQVAAPGDSVYSTYAGSTFQTLSGTSMATPFVSGLAALALIQAPQLTGYQVKQIIMNSAQFESTLTNVVATSGRVNSLSAYQAAVGSVSLQAYQPNYIETVPPGQSATSGTTSAGCGTVSATLLDAAFWSKDGGSGGNSSGALGVVVGLLMMPLMAWAIVRSRFVSRQRRKHDRFVMNSEVKVQVDGRELVGRLATIGAGGVSFSADQMLAKGGLVTMQIQSPNGDDEIQVVGRIVWNEKTAHGVQFGPVAETMVEKISSWTKNLSKAA